MAEVFDLIETAGAEEIENVCKFSDKNPSNFMELNDILNISINNVEESDDEEANDNETEPVYSKPNSDNEEKIEKNEENNNKENTTTEQVKFFMKRNLKYQTLSSALEPLPEDWVAVPHNCGLPVYLHKPTKVVTWSRPYHVFSGGIRKHKVAVSSIPCLEFERNRERLDNKKQPSPIKQNGLDLKKEPSETKDSGCNNASKSSNSDISFDKSTSDEVMPQAILHSHQNQYLDISEWTQYLDRKFVFETIQIPHFERWADKRKFNKQLKKEEKASQVEENIERKKLGPAKVITLTIPRGESGEKTQRVIFNTSIKPMVCVLHEYAQSVLKTKPHYLFSTKEDSSQPFQATIVINDKHYGSASGINKKTAKNKAALATMEILVPGFKNQVEEVSGESSAEYFDNISVNDSRIFDLCIHAGNYLPYQLLTECLKRNQGITDMNVQFDAAVGDSKMIDYTMTCGKHSVSGSAKNKKVGKQTAAQQILALLHPQVKYWGDLIKMYGISVAEKRAKKKNIEQEIFELKQKRNGDDELTTARNRESLTPNPELLNKLKDMMVQLGKETKSLKRDNIGASNDGDAQGSSSKKIKLLKIDI